MLKVAVTWLQTFEMWLQYFKICNHVTATSEVWLQNSKSDCKTHIYDGNFFKNDSNLKNNDCNLNKKWQQFKKKMQSRDWDFWWNLNASFNILQSHFELWLQLSTFCGHISNHDCNFRHFAVTFQIMSATFNILQSHFELWLQNDESCSHVTVDFKSYSHVIAYFKICNQISNYDCHLLKVSVTWLHLLKSAVTWLQLSTFCSYNSKCNCRFQELQS